ncbi:MAG: hypothetical protein QM526_00225 [Alphaproteobacteria bacterium]|nr:hypothetical protein [Alphaproteobacteria bacterium]
MPKPAQKKESDGGSLLGKYFVGCFYIVHTIIGSMISSLLMAGGVALITGILTLFIGIPVFMLGYILRITMAVITFFIFFTIMIADNRLSFNLVIRLILGFVIELAPTPIFLSSYTHFFISYVFLSKTKK